MFKLFLFAHYELFCLLFLTDIPSLLGFLLRTFFFLIPENISNFMWLFPNPLLESALSPKSPGFFYWKQILEAKNPVPDVIAAL